MPNESCQIQRGMRRPHRPNQIQRGRDAPPARPSASEEIHKGNADFALPLDLGFDWTGCPHYTFCAGSFVRWV